MANAKTLMQLLPHLGGMLRTTKKSLTRSLGHKGTRSYDQRVKALRRKYATAAVLSALNVSIFGWTAAQGTPARMHSLRTVESAMNPQAATVQKVQVTPIKEPVALVAEIVTEKVVATPTPTPTTAVAGVSTSTPAISAAPNRGNWDALLQAHFGPAWQEARAIMMCESGGNANAVGGAWTGIASYGLMQIRALPGRPSPQWLVNPENNVSYAAGIYRAQGWGPWSCKYVLGR
jgi:hypothetical protein